MKADIAVTQPLSQKHLEPPELEKARRNPPPSLQVSTALPAPSHLPPQGLQEKNPSLRHHVCICNLLQQLWRTSAHSLLQTKSLEARN